MTVEQQGQRIKKQRLVVDAMNVLDLKQCTLERDFLGPEILDPIQKKKKKTPGYFTKCGILIPYALKSQKLIDSTLYAGLSLSTCILNLLLEQNEPSVVFLSGNNIYKECLKFASQVVAQRGFKTCFFSNSIEEDVEFVSSITDIPKSTLIVDGILGGLLANEEEKAQVLELIKWTKKQTSKILSLNIQSGLDGDTAKPILNISVRADYIVALGLPFLGLIKQKIPEIFICDTNQALISPQNMGKLYLHRLCARLYLK